MIRIFVPIPFPKNEIINDFSGLSFLQKQESRYFLRVLDSRFHACAEALMHGSTGMIYKYII